MIDLLVFVLCTWWLAFVPGVLLFTTFDAIRDWIEVKANEIRSRS